MHRFILTDSVIVCRKTVLYFLGYLLETEADVAVQNIRGKDTGQLSVAIYPTSDGIVRVLDVSRFEKKNDRLSVLNGVVLTT